MSEQEIKDLINKYAEGTATQAEVGQLMEWYHSAPLDEVLWPVASAGDKEIVYDRMLQRLDQATRPKTAVRSLTWVRVAALLIIIVGIGLAIPSFFRGATTSYITISNASGQIKQVTLPDSSKVWLNAVSEVRYAKDFKTDRNIDLKGEAFFDVAPDASHPFRINAGALTTTVLGTSFNIKAYENEKTISVSVVHGRVQVEDSSGTIGLLTPSMQLKFNRSLKTATLNQGDTVGFVAWKGGKLQFDGSPLGDIAASLERWYGVTIEFENPAMKDCRYYMGFSNKTPLADLLSTIAELTGMRYSIDSEKKLIVFSGKGCDQ